MPREENSCASDGEGRSKPLNFIDLFCGCGGFTLGMERAGNESKKRVAALEAAFQANLVDSRFLPYIQLHEFEALLYCDLSQLQQRIADSERAFAALAREVRGMEPEEIDEGATTAPSKRIINHVPIYDRLKVRVGAPAAAAIGLPALRARCPHFSEWVGRLEGLAA